MITHPRSVKREGSDHSLISAFSISNDPWCPPSPSHSTSSTSSSQSVPSLHSTSRDPALWSSDPETVPSSPIEQRDSEHPQHPTLPKPTSPSSDTPYARVYLAYSKETLSSTTTDFKILVDFLHFRDRTPILNFTNENRRVLFRTPAGYGKTSAISMLNHFYDFRFDSTFAHNFQNTEAENYKMWDHNDSYVLNLDFGRLGVKDHDFDIDKKLNSALEEFVKDYGLFSSTESESIQYQDPVAASTLNNIIENAIEYAENFKLVICIDDYDIPYWEASELESVEECRKVHETLGNFFEEIACWTSSSSFISLVFITGETSILPFLPGLRTRFPVFDIKDEDFADGVHGFDEDDVQRIGQVLNERFHSLGLDVAANTFLESSEAMMETSQCDYLGYSCNTVLRFYRDRLEHAAREVESTPALRLPLKTS
ncbi:hypothetical protein V5O48_018599 [Marasmius crinis-equi]|uniref:AAA-ATPase-like domain-containing protein n=1 Tax=Marasmius crinis-equi TaxID=585013 RepID=A0ABR3EKT1_9AGAR